MRSLTSFVKGVVRRRLHRRWDVPTIPLALERLSASFRPASIYDVGAYRGDFARECLRVWPDARVTCFEPLPHRADELEGLARTCPGVTVMRCLVGAESRDAVPLHEAETASSVLSEHVPQGFPVREHPMRSLDSVVADGLAPPPDLVKIDVQGYELEVLRGAERTLPRAQAILTEVNLLDIHAGVPLLADVVHWLHERGWAAFDVCGTTRRPLDRALWQVDMIFVPRGSPLRADKRWADGSRAVAGRGNRE